MNDSINRQVTIDAINQYYEDKKYITRSRTILSAFCQDMKNIMSSLPSAESVRHGEWIEHKDYPGLAYLCSECNSFTTDRSYYCPCCGAKMDNAKIMATTNLTVPIVINWKDVEKYMAQYDMRCENCANKRKSWKCPMAGDPNRQEDDYCDCWERRTDERQ